MLFKWLLISVTFISSELKSECLPGDSLWKRIVYLRESAVPAHKQLRELLNYLEGIERCTYKNDSTHALLLQRIGWLYTEQNDYVNAIQYTRNAIDLIDKQKNHTRIKRDFTIKCYYNLNLMYSSLKLPAQKETAIDSCISRSIQFATGYDYALEVLTWKIETLFERGDYYRCIQMADLGERIIVNSGVSKEDMEYYEMNYFTWKVNALNFVKQSDVAEEAIIRKVIQYKKIKNNGILGPLYSLYAKFLSSNGKPNEAIDYYRRSFKLNLLSKHNEGCAQALNNIGYTYFQQLKQYKSAQHYYLKALAFAGSNEALNIQDNIANLYVVTGDFDAAFYHFQKAFDQLEPGLNETSLVNKNQETLAGSTMAYVTGLVLDKGDARLALYRKNGELKELDAAIRIYLLTDRFFDKIRATQYETLSKLTWKANYRRLYERAIEACHARKNVASAFYFFEKSRSILLNDKISEQHGMTDLQLSQQAQLKKNILDLEKTEQTTNSSDDNYPVIQNQLFTARQQLEVFNKMVQVAHPNNTYDTTYLTLQQARSLFLKGNNSLIELFNGDSAIYVLAITPVKLFLTRVDKTAYDRLAQTYIDLLADPGRLNNDFANFCKVSHNLYMLLFGKIELPEQSSLMISPDGKNFPFESLVTNTDAGDPHYLLARYATSYIYSAKYLQNYLVQPRKKELRILGIAPVSFDKRLNLSTLSGSDQSLLRIKQHFKTADNFLLSRASKANFLRHFPDYTIIQLYTHAADNSDKSDPVIYFADSTLFLSELISDRKPSTELIVLSACETATGKIYKGEGIFSFNRGFAALGIPAAVSNLWSVNNETTYRVTELFYQYLAEGFESDVALQKAKLAFLATGGSIEKKLPYYWAGTILVGKTGKFMPAKSFPWGEGIAIISIALIAGLLIRYKRNKRKSVNIPVQPRHYNALPQK